MAAVVATDVSDLTLIGQGVYYVSNGTAGNITSLLGEAAGGGTSITTTNQNLNVKIGTLVDAPGGADADAAVIRLSGFN